MNTAKKQKRRLALFVAIIMVLGLWTAAPLQTSAATAGAFTTAAGGGAPATFYHVRFMPNLPGGNDITGMPAEQLVLSKAKAVKPDSPATAFYTFDDWYTAADGKEKFDFNAEINEHTEIFAHWTAKEAAVTYYKNDGTDAAYSFTDTIPFGGKIANAPTEPSRTDYTFGGWYTEAAATNEWQFGSDKGTELTGENGAKGAVGENPTLSLYAKWIETDNPFVVTADDKNKLTSADYYYDNFVLNIRSGRAMTVSMADGATTAFKSTIRINNVKDENTNITLNDVKIDVSEASDVCALNVVNSTLNVTLKGANELKSGANRAGLQLINGTSLVITEASTGSLTAQGLGAGIGAGNNTAAGGNIQIDGGNITAIGGSNNGAGIGGGAGDASVGNITITGGKIKAVANGSGAGIGSGHGQKAKCGDITITGGEIEAAGGISGGAGIGGGNGNDATCGPLTITGGTVTAEARHENSQDIGSGIASGGNNNAAASVTITGGSVWAVNDKVAPAPKNSQKDGGKAVYANKLAFNPALDADTAITTGSINEVDCVTTVPTAAETTAGKYGIKDVKAVTDPSAGTDNAVRVSLWLPNADPAQTVKLQTADDGYEKSYIRSGTVTETLKRPGNTYVLTSDLASKTFDALPHGYSETSLTAQMFTITNTGTGTITDIDATLSGTNADNFTLTKTGMSKSLAAAATTTVSVVPKTNLGIGTYTATLTVEGSDKASVDAALSFEVTAPVYHVTFKPNAGKDSVGNMPKEQNVVSGSKANAPASHPTRAGYTFDNWYTQATDGAVFDFTNTAITGNTSMYARWTAKGGYTVSYDTAGGIPASVSDKENVTWTTAGLLPKTAPTKAGHTFAGWNVTSGGSGKNVQSAATYGDVAIDDSTKTITLTAQWTVNPVTPTYALTVTNGTGGSGSSSYAENATVTITANPAPEGQIFDTWESSNGGTFGDANSAATTFTMPAKTVTVTANYKDDPNPPVTNGWVYKDGVWKYFVNGKAKIGWIYDKSKWYYTNAAGEMQTGWVCNQNKWYYLAGNGAMKTGWVKDKGNWYYLSGNGTIVVNKWFKDADGSWYYLSGSGKMLTGKQKIGGKTYSFKANGVWIG